MSSTDFTKVDSKSLARLMRLETKTASEWQPGDFAGMWRHQLKARLLFDLSDTKKEANATITSIQQKSAAAPRTFGELFQHPHPPVELLRLTKEFAKESRKDKESPLPKEIATALYFASILVALTRCGKRITTLTDAELRKGIKWTVAQPWLADATRSVLNEGLALLEN